MLHISRLHLLRRRPTSFKVLIKGYCAPRNPQNSSDANEFGAQIYNSLTKSKTALEKPSGSPLKWYSCGPTVYDASHLGHARNYVSQDIIRRVLEDYFGYDVHFVMNITDIDDKIIARTRETFFVDRLASQYTQLSPELLDYVDHLLHKYVEKHLPGLALSGLTVGDGSKARWEHLLGRVNGMLENAEELQNGVRRMHASTVRECLNSLIAAHSRLSSSETKRTDGRVLIRDSTGVLGPMLNIEFSQESIDPALFTHTASQWESKFFEDMHRLNVLPPDTVTRASEYVSEIIAFIDGIIEKGYGYLSNGSVYFDTNAFIKSGSHQYNKLLTANAVPQDVMSEQTPFSQDKKSNADFSLWKATKPGEPAWLSPWGPGRPGWHIECSAMASAVFGERVHLHSGGVDLLFPHHTNELAQSEAYYGCKDWVDCFIHIGHLHIDGLKMSKSLKNFVTIEDILEKYTSRQLRLAFLLRSWNSPLDFSEAIMTQEVIPLETSLTNFFRHVSALALDQSTFRIGHAFGAQERELRTNFDDARASFRRALQDSINTPTAMSTLRNLVSRTNVYIHQNPKGVDALLVLGITRWITKMLQMFGLCTYDDSRIGWELSEPQKQNNTDALLPYLQTLAAFRDNVRKIAKSNGPDLRKDVLKLCDELRDRALPALGVQLTDRADGPALIQFVSTDTAAPKTPTTGQTTASSEDSETNASKVVNPREFFKPPHVPDGLYGSWDEAGIPLTDAEGKLLSKGQRKNLRKRWKAQMVVYNQSQVNL